MAPRVEYLTVPRSGESVARNARLRYALPEPIPMARALLPLSLAAAALPPLVRQVACRRTLDALVILAALVSIPLTAAQLGGDDTLLVTSADWLIWSVFLLDFTLGMRAGPTRRAALRRHWLSAVVVTLTFPLTPSLLHGLRLARLARLLRVARLLALASWAAHGLGLVLGRRGLVYTGGLAGLVILVGASGLALVEPETVKGSYWQGLWWAVVTSTTVGYGDIAPVTTVGRVIGVIVMITGIGLVSTLAASITAYFVAQDENSELRDLRARLERIEQLLLDARAHPAGTVPTGDTAGKGSAGAPACPHEPPARSPCEAPGQRPGAGME
jgi:voltage-gated potassium channel